MGHVEGREHGSAELSYPTTVKWFEVRDRGTLMSCMAIKLGYDNQAERRCMRQAGFESLGRVVVYWPSDHEASYDPYRFVKHAFGLPVRTQFEATRYIQENFNELVHGQVVDVEYILGETASPKVTELRPSM